jgi:Skp family chaperone for outer membrane proteins
MLNFHNKGLCMYTNFLRLGVLVSVFSLTASNLFSAADVCAAKVDSNTRGTRVAVVDPQSIIAGVDEWRDMAEAAQKNFQQMFDSLGAQKEEFAKIRAAGAQADAKKLAKLQKDIEIEERDLEMQLQEAQKGLQMTMMQKIDAGIITVAEGKWDIVTPKVFYAHKDFDITQDVIKQMNADYKKIKAASKFTKKASAGMVAPVEPSAQAKA